MSLICGPCAIQQHHKCTGLLRTEFGFCACADRQHADKPAGDDLVVRKKNEAIILAHVSATLHGGEV